jgi:hypothetical protein
LKRCDDTRLQDYVQGQLAADEVAAVDRHVAECADCSRRVEEYRLLFADLAELPMPPVPPGIPDEVLARLTPVGFTARLRARLASPAARPIFASLTGIAAGLLLAIFREPLALYAGQTASALLTGGTEGLLRSVNTGISQFTEWTVILEVLVHGFLKLATVVRALIDVVPAVVGRAWLLSFALTLAMALLFVRLVGHLRREEFGHAKH